jgi:putative serine protease PepD
VAHTRFIRGLVAAAVLALAAEGRAAPPVAEPPASEPAAGAAAKPNNAGLSVEDRAALAGRVVVLERAGKVLGLGVILNADGRIVTALSLLGDARHIDARYGDKKLVPVRVGHADRAHDLALVVPANAEHKLGLKAAPESAPALHAPLGSFVSADGKVIPGRTVSATGPSSYNGNDGTPYPEAIAFTTPLAAASAGGPLIDEKGEVVGMVTRACQKKPGATCAAVLVGTPVGVVREFLRAAPKTAVLPTASLGIEVVADDAGPSLGVRVTGAHGPASTLGLRAGNDARTADVIVALDGAPVTTLEAYEHALEDRAVGDVVDLLVLGSGRYRHVTAVVAPAPH